jgi:predicted CoA-binding protein
MPSEYETFWQMNRYAVVGHGKSERPFPKLTYGALKKNGKVVFAIDPSAEVVEGDRAFADLTALPETVDAVVIEVPKTETMQWCRQAVECGIKDIWLHGNTETPEVVAYAKEHAVRLRTGTCAVMYLHRGFSPHAVHRFINRLRGKY